MLNRKRNLSRSKKENKKKCKKNEREILDLPLKQKKEQNIAKEKNVRGRRKKEINKNSIHNNEDQNNNSENIKEKLLILLI